MKFFKLFNGKYVNLDNVAYIKISESELKVYFCFSAIENEITDDCVVEEFNSEDDFNQFVEFLDRISFF